MPATGSDTLAIQYGHSLTTIQGYVQSSWNHLVKFLGDVRKLAEIDDFDTRLLFCEGQSFRDSVDAYNARSTLELCKASGALAYRSQSLQYMFNLRQFKDDNKTYPNTNDVAFLNSCVDYRVIARG